MTAPSTSSSAMSIYGNVNAHLGYITYHSPRWHVSFANANPLRHQCLPFATTQLAGKKRAADDGVFGTARAKRRASAKVEFIPGTFRALVIIDDDDDYPVVFRGQRGKRGRDPIMIEDEFPPLEARYASHRMAVATSCSHQSVEPTVGFEDSPDCTGTLGVSSSVGNRDSRSSPSVRVETDNDDLDPSSFLDYSFEDELEKQLWAHGTPPFASPLGQQSKSNPSDIFTIEDAAERSPKRLKDSMSCEDRKRAFVYNPTPEVLYRMKCWVEGLYDQLDHSRDPNECWIHPSPPSPNKKGRPKGAVSRSFKWSDDTGEHRLWVNFGVVALLLEGLMTDVQKDGFIEERWHLSHLCGNWLCLNTSHFTVEPGSVNVGRNCCFTHRNGCSHMPRCMKDKKRKPLTPALASLYGLEGPTKHPPCGVFGHFVNARDGLGVAGSVKFSS